MLNWLARREAMKESRKIEEEDVEKDKIADQENEASQEANAAVKCAHCGENMFCGVLPRFNRFLGIIILVMGVLLSLFTSPLLGLPIVVIGAYMAAASRSIWMCESCGTIVERIDS
jgi:hypothetical protein